MSQSQLEPQYAILNNCEPCQAKPILTAMYGAREANMVGKARVVEPHVDTNSYTVRMKEVLTHVNAINRGESVIAHPKAYLTGYTAGKALY
jgi:hypothetical protein